jgi:excisionase family DNA binding protein
MLITISRVARLLNRSQSTVRKLTARGELPCTVTEDGLRLYDRDAIEVIARERRARRPARHKATPVSRA